MFQPKNIWLTIIAKMKLSTNWATPVDMYDLNAYETKLSFLHILPIIALRIAFSIADAAKAHALPNTTYQVPPIVALSASFTIELLYD